MIAFSLARVISGVKNGLSNKKSTLAGGFQYLEINGTVQHAEVVGLVDHLAIGVHIHLYARPVGVDVTVLLNEDIVEDVVGDAAAIRLHDGGVRQGLMVGHVQTLVLEVEAVTHTAAVETAVGEQPLEILQDWVVVLLVQVLGGGLGIVVAELDGDTVGQETLHIGGQLLCGILLVQHAVDAGGASDLGDHLVGGLLHILLQVAGDVHAGDLILVALSECQHLL